MKDFIKELNAHAEVYDRLAIPSETAKLFRKAAKTIEELSKDKARLDWVIPAFMTRSTAILNKFDIYVAHGMSERQAIDAAMEGN